MDPVKFLEFGIMTYGHDIADIDRMLIELIDAFRRYSYYMRQIYNISFDSNNIPHEDRMLLEMIDKIDLDILFRSPEFNRQLRIRMKHYKLP